MLIRRLLCLSAVLVLATTVPVAAWADSPPSARVLSLFETSKPGNSIHRDAGFSAIEPGAHRSLWLFGDSTWTGGGFWFGTTAAVGPYTAGLVPSQLTEIPTPSAAIDAPSNRAPQGFLPRFPSGLKQPDGHACTNGSGGIPVSWPTGAAAEPAGGRMLITYADVCETKTNDRVERFSVAEYNPRSNSLSGLASVFTDKSGLPNEEYLGSPIFLGKAPNAYLYLIGSTCSTEVPGDCTSGKITLARVPANAAHWRDPGAYRWWNGSAWVADHARAASIIPGARPVALAYAGNFGALGKGFVIITQTDLAGHFTVWQSSRLTGTWHGTSGKAPCRSGAGLNLCRAYIGHPELSTKSYVMMSFYNPGDDHLSAMKARY
jgi:hypothetical protein